MWVRSQDKTRLGKIERFEYEEDMYGFYLFGWDDIYTGNRLATYSSKEKALKVLDMIQKHINELNYKEPSWKNNYVFQMPQDDEV